MTILRIFILCLFNIYPGAYAMEQTFYPFHSTTDATRFEYFIKEIRCVVCQNQSLADSNAPLANDLRKKIYEMMLNKKNNEEIKDYLVKRYGEFILLNPRVNKLTLLLWSFPFLGLIFAFFCLWYLIGYTKNNKSSHIVS
jgi:cytochrome c-type biogenesis protein CcmH